MNFAICTLPNAITAFNEEGFSWAGNVEGMWEMRNAYTVLVARDI